MEYNSVPVKHYTSIDVTEKTPEDEISDSQNTDQNDLLDDDIKQPQQLESDNDATATKLDFDINSSPPWHLCILLGFQHYLTMVGGMLAVPLLISSTFCFQGDLISLSEIYGTTFFACGIATLLQTTLGCRLPIVQGASFTFLTAAMSILSLDKWHCPPLDNGKHADVGSTSNLEVNITPTTEVVFEQATELPWKSRMREIQGAIIVSSFFEVLIGLTGLVGVLTRVIGPLTVAPIISLVGISLFHVGATHSSHNWWISFLTMALIAIFSRYLDKYDIPIIVRKDKKWKKGSFPLLRLFPVILAIAVSWIICAILTATNVVPDDPNHWAYNTRTDTKTYVLKAAKWFRVPYPFQWGPPTFSVAGVISMFSVIIISVVESIGDYYACARVAGAPIPPIHALNRGIFMEGIGCIVSGVLGTGTGLTSFSENIGAISITRVGSRRVLVAGSFIMLVLGVFAKFGAIFVAIPEPIVGGVFIVIFGVITAIGVSNLQFVDMNSPRNVFIFGFSMMIGMSLPSWLSENPNAINTGSTTLNQILSVLGMTNLFVGGAVAMFLDNTIPGTAKERGLLSWTGKTQSGCGDSKNDDDDSLKTYDLPLIMGAIRRWTWTRYVPISPTFKGFSSMRFRSTKKSRDSLNLPENGFNNQ